MHLIFHSCNISNISSRCLSLSFHVSTMFFLAFLTSSLFFIFKVAAISSRNSVFSWFVHCCAVGFIVVLFFFQYCFCDICHTFCFFNWSLYYFKCHLVLFKWFSIFLTFTDWRNSTILVLLWARSKLPKRRGILNGRPNQVTTNFSYC